MQTPVPDNPGYAFQLGTPMTDRQVIYEVRLELDPEAPAVIEAFDSWLPDHIAEMVRLPGFVSGQQVFEETLGASESAWPARTVHYTLQDRAALDAYFSDHAERMQLEGRQRFGAHLRATRRIFARGNALLSAEVEQTHCRNCGRALLGQYCRECGQRDRSRMISAWELVRDFLGDAFELDSRLWRSVIPLLARPGFLTREYLRGRRVHYTPPLRMYLVITLGLFFMLAALPGLQASFELPSDIRITTGEQIPTPVDGEAAPDGIDGAATDAGGDARDLPGPQTDPPGSAERVPAPGQESTARDRTPEEICREAVFNLAIGDEDYGEALRPRLHQICIRVVRDRGRGLSREIIGNIPTMMFIFLPLIALVMKVLYIGSRRYYVEHLLFFVHYHSATFLIIGLSVLLGQMAAPFPQLSAPLEAVSVAVMLYLPWYLFRAMRVVYGQGRIFTFTKFLLLGSAYFFGLVSTFFVGALVTALTWA